MEEARCDASAAEAPGSLKSDRIGRLGSGDQGVGLNLWSPFSCIAPSFAFLEAIAVVAGLDDFASMLESIEQGGWSSWRRRRTSWYKLFELDS